MKISQEDAILIKNVLPVKRWSARLKAAEWISPRTRVVNLEASTVLKRILKMGTIIVRQPGMQQTALGA